MGGLPGELLYADNLILMAERKESLCVKTVKWKSRMEVTGLKTNTDKTKMFSATKLVETENEGNNWPTQSDLETLLKQCV